MDAGYQSPAKLFGCSGLSRAIVGQSSAHAALPNLLSCIRGRAPDSHSASAPCTAPKLHFMAQKLNVLRDPLAMAMYGTLMADEEEYWRNCDIADRFVVSESMAATRFMRLRGAGLVDFVKHGYGVYWYAKARYELDVASVMNRCGQPDPTP